jgi:hypothetical protein
MVVPRLTTGTWNSFLVAVLRHLIHINELYSTLQRLSLYFERQGQLNSQLTGQLFSSFALILYISLIEYWLLNGTAQ